MARFKQWFTELDELLRGRKTEASLLAQGTRHIRLGPCIASAITLGIVYGIFMGLFAVMTRNPPCWEQMLATSIKVPALFFLTLIVTFPSLYVFSALLGVSLRLVDTLRVLVAAMTVNLCVLAAFGPITGFFTISTTSYTFMKLLNVLFFAVAGMLGVGFLFKVLHILEESSRQGGPPKSARAQRILTIWLTLYALVGAQMGWVLRPFIGSPTLKFEIFRDRQSDFFTNVFKSLFDLFHGGG